MPNPRFNDHLTLEDLEVIANACRLLRPYLLRPERLLRIFNAIELYIREALEE